MTRDLTRVVTVETREAPPSGALLLAPEPFDHWGQRLASVKMTGVEAGPSIPGDNTRCRAIPMRPLGDGPCRIVYTVALGETAAPGWVWERQDNRATIAGPELAANARRLVDGAPSQRAALDRLIADAAEHFGYGHVDMRFNDGHDAVPMVCGLATGSCVDINTYLLAGARAAGLTGQYIAGYWFHPHKTETTDMHCWLAFEVDGEIVFWDVAHALKWAATLDATLQEGLNPAGGRRVAMTCGRYLRFMTPNGAVEISHFSEPVWVLPDGSVREADLSFSVRDPEGFPADIARTQFPTSAPATVSA